MVEHRSPSLGPILLITDLSSRCDRAMDRAARMAKLHRVGLIVLHVVETPWLTKLAQPAWRTMQAEHLVTAEKRVKQDLGEIDVEVKVLIETGHPTDVIVAVASEHRCSLIVTGTARDETLGRMVLGTTVERLARRCETPLLIVRSRPFHPYSRVTVATDFSEGSRQALSTAVTLMPEASFTLFHAFDQVAGIYDLDQPTIQEESAARAKTAATFIGETQVLKGKQTPAVVIEHGTAEQRLPGFVQAEGSDLVVLGTHGVTGIVRTAMGSVAEKLLSVLRCDVMVVRQPHQLDD